MNSNQKNTNRKKGSSSVLVIMVMLFLISLGVLVLVSARSNLTLAQKNADWISGYYDLESLANEHLSQVQTFLKSDNELTVEKLKALQIEDFALDLEQTHQEENTWTIAYESNLVALNRRFYTQLKVTYFDDKIEIQREAWVEKPTEFEYEEGLEFDDVGG